MSEFIDYGSVNHRIRQFDQRHGASVVDNGWIRFEDGAVRESNPMGLLVEPPSVPWDLAKRKARYHEVIFLRAMQVFDEFKSRHLGMAHANLNAPTCGPAAQHEEVMKELKRLQSIARSAKENYDAAMEVVEEATPGQVRQRQQMNHENRRQNERLVTAINDIEI